MAQRRAFVRFVRAAWKWAAVLLLIGGVVYYVRFRPVQVRTYTSSTGTVRQEVMGTGTLEARVHVTISSEIAGRLASVAVDQNSRVTKGQVLAVLDDSDLHREVKVAEAILQEREAALVRAQADVARAEAVLEQAKKDHERITRLVKDKVSTQADLDKAVERLGVAQADLGRAKAAVAEARSRIVSASQTLELQQARLDETRITSPFDGLVVSREREPGEVVVPGTPILEAVATDEVWVSAWVDESVMAALKPEQPARVVFRAEPDKAYAGEVLRLARQVDRETREFLMDVRLHELPVNWAIGQRADVYVLTGRKDGVTVIPPKTIAHQDGKPGVFVNESGRARWRMVTLGLRGRDGVEVKSGVRAGEEILVPADGAATQLRDGQAIAK